MEEFTRSLFMKILVVDDDKMMLETIAHSLKADGYEIITAADGVKALEIIEEKELNLIISDIMMPNMSGLGLLSIMKQFYYNRIPVILISSLDKGEIILSALGMGAEDFIVKPLNFTELSLRVKKVLNNQEKPKETT